MADNYIPAVGDLFFAHSKRLGVITEEGSVPDKFGNITNISRISHGPDEVFDKIILSCKAVGEEFILCNVIWCAYDMSTYGRKVHILTKSHHRYAPVEPEFLAVLGIDGEKEKTEILDLVKDQLKRIREN